MASKIARVTFVYLPLLFLLLLQAVALLILYGGKMSGKDDTMIDLSTRVPGLRFGWPIIFVVALVCHLGKPRRVESRSS